MSEQHDRARPDETTSPGSAGDGGVVEAAGTLGGVTASADGEIIRAERGGEGGAVREQGTGRAGSDTSADIRQDAGSDANATAEPPTDSIHGYEDLESDPGV